MISRFFSMNSKNVNTIIKKGNFNPKKRCNFVVFFSACFEKRLRRKTDQAESDIKSLKGTRLS